MMDLFPVQRYFGDETTSKGRDAEVEGNMSKLLSKIKQRAKIKKVTSGKVCEKEENTSLPSLPDDSQEELKSPKVKKKKKDSYDQDFKTESNSSVNDEIPNVLSKELNHLTVNDNQQIESNDSGHGTEEFSGENGVNNISKETFHVLGDHKFKKKTKVKRVLPDWLANPSVVSVDLKNLNVHVDDISDLHPTLLNTLKRNSISHFFPVQAQVIPWLLESKRKATFFWPCDICVSAPTGSGKTLAYVLPILQGLMGCRIGQIQALVVLPVQDLAAQVAAVFRTYSVNTGLKVHLSTGGSSLPEDRAHLLRQRLGAGWESLVDILVITPGRLVEHIYSTPGFSLKNLQYIVIDEADRIVDNMQNNWLHHLEQHLSVQGCPLLTLKNLKTMPRRPQKLLFSATLSIDPEKLNQLRLFQPRLFTSVVEATKDQGKEGEFIGKFTTPAELEERMVRCSLSVKPLVLYRMIARESWTRVLVFTSSSRSVHQLCALLSLLAQKSQQALNVQEISAECSPKKREAVLADFAAGVVDVLVSTDALARGIDIPNVKYVISYDMPKFVKAYIHRVGRTGRAGQPGTAVTMVQHTQVGLFHQMLQTAGKQDTISEITIEQEELKALETQFKEALNELKNVTKEEQTEKLKKTKAMKRTTLIAFAKKIKRVKQERRKKIKRVKQETRKVKKNKV